MSLEPRFITTSPHALTPSLPHSLTPSLPHFLTTQVHHYLPSLPHSLTPSLPHSITLSLHHSLATQFHHYLPSLPHSLIPSHHHSLATSKEALDKIRRQSTDIAIRKHMTIHLNCHTWLTAIYVMQSVRKIQTDKQLQSSTTNSYKKTNSPLLNIK